MRCQAGACLQTWEICGVKVVFRVQSWRRKRSGGLFQTSDREPIVGLVRDFLSLQPTSFEMRTARHKSNVARLYGSFAEMWFILLEKDESDEPHRVAQPEI